MSLQVKDIFIFIYFRSTFNYTKWNFYSSNRLFGEYILVVVLVL